MVVLLASLAALLYLAYYAASCLRTPFRPCGKCSGTGQGTTVLLHRPKSCRRCGGKGTRLRHGRRLHNRWALLHQRGTR
jgi:hypothetical protein